MALPSESTGGCVCVCVYAAGGIILLLGYTNDQLVQGKQPNTALGTPFNNGICVTLSDLASF